MNRLELGLYSAQTKTENIPQPAFHSQEKPPHTIFDYYSIENEVAFLTKQRQKGATDEFLISYLNNNVLRCLGEFAGRLKSDKITYLWNNGRLYYQGVVDPINETYKESARQTPAGSREKAESDGFAQIETVLNNNQDAVCFWLSPPSFGKQGFGSYGFLYVWLNYKDHVDEHILLYENEDRNFTKSTEIYFHLQPYAIQKDQSKEGAGEMFFLKNPLFAKPKNQEDFVRKLLTTLNFDDESQKFSQENAFISKVKNDQYLSQWINDYIMYMLELSSDNSLDSAAEQALLSQAKQQFQTIYNRAVELNTPSSTMITNHETAVTRFNDERKAYGYYTNQKPEVIGGGSCPVSSTINNLLQTSNGILTYEVSSKIWKLSKEDNNCGKVGCYEASNHFHCPKCGALIPSNKGITQCPNSSCRITKEEYARETNTYCD